MKESPELKQFGTSIHEAIARASIVPKHVWIFGSKGTGIVKVSFDYLDGKVNNVKIVKSSGDKYEDAAAIQAVKVANYPPTPDLYKGQSMRFFITLKYPSISPAPNSTIGKSSFRMSIHR